MHCDAFYLNKERIKIMQRIDKILANRGFGTRKEVKGLIRDGAVEIDGLAVCDPGYQVDASRQAISVNGEAIEYREYIYIIMNKPKGVVSATEDKTEKTVVELLSPKFRVFEPFPVGRLDKDTEGLLVLTNDGQLSHRLLAPKKHVPKTYFARIEGRVTEEDIEAFKKGVLLDDGYKTLPAELGILERGRISLIEVRIYEGKFHQVKRMFKAVGKEVLYLKRTAMGGLVLDEGLKPGEYREMTAEELQKLQEGV